MDSLLNRYRNVTVLLLVVFAQLLLLAYQVKSNQDVRLIRVWAVTAVTPMARLIESARSGTVYVFENYFLLRNAMSENVRLKADLGKLKMENHGLRAELETADRVRALLAFQAHSPSRAIAARVIATGTVSTSKVVFLDRGSRDGVLKSMAVVTPDGIVGKVIAAYPTASQVLLITDSSFAAGVISQKHRVHGTAKGLGHTGACLVDYIQSEQKVEVGEMFYTSGDDRVFPKGLPVGAVTSIRPGNPMKQVYITPSGLQGGLEEVLVVLEGVHQPVPEYQTAGREAPLLPPPPQEGDAAAVVPSGEQAPVGTEADRMRDRYRKIGEAQGHVFGEGAPGSKPPDFNLPLKPAPAPAPAPAAPVKPPTENRGPQAVPRAPAP